MSKIESEVLPWETIRERIYGSLTNPVGYRLLGDLYANLPKYFDEKKLQEMLDNMPCAEMRKCVKMCKGISKTEASGGITLADAKKVAATGVTAISLGCLTHSAGSIDLSLEWQAI